MQLKQYQQDALNKLAEFLSLSRETQPENAFAQMQPGARYKNPGNQWSIPYVCVRIPTGGGKTLLAAYSIAQAAKHYLDCERPVVLWLVPSKTIKSQTVEALNKNDHPYRAALNAAFNREVIVLEAEQFTQIKPQDLGSKTIVMVSTIQNFRVDDTSGRKIYQHHELLETHFQRLNKNVLHDLYKIKAEDLKENGLTQKDIGKIKYSFANLLSAHHPLVIVDEAHNARTPLTFETLRRVKPAAILEFTATPHQDPQNGSNIIYHVGAAVLKNEHMIKLPILLTDHSQHSWEEIVDAAILQRADLAQKAQHEADYIRPIVLFQAENKNGEVTTEKLREYLTNSHSIASEKIAVVTGTQRELDGIDILSPTCPVEFVITVEALKEGWDCHFAYVFCSLQHVSSAKDAEQLLGRVLRMPYAKKRTVQELNWAYAHLFSPKFGEAAIGLTDKLINQMGFNHFEVAKNLQVTQQQQGGLYDDLPLTQKTKQQTDTFELTSVPNINKLPANQIEKITISPQPNGGAIVQISGSIESETEKLLLQNVPVGKKRDSVKTQIAVHNKSVELAKSPSECGFQFPALPQICIQHQGELLLFEPKVLLNLASWNINDYPAQLNFQMQNNQMLFSIDVNEQEKLKYQQSPQQLNFNDDFMDFTADDLVNWLDRKIEHSDTPRHQMLIFLDKIIQHLLSKSNVQLSDLLRNKFALARSIEGLINRYREKAMRKNYQATLFDDHAQVKACINEQFFYTFTPENYAPQPPYYLGNYRFGKHFFHEIENLKYASEEFECAKILDTLSDIKYWIRNPDLGKRGFWLPLSGVLNNRFFPDFICELHDGRILVIEYKGEHLQTNDDSKEKNTIGKHWAKMSGGKCLFAMISKQDAKGQNMQQQILSAISA